LPKIALKNARVIYIWMGVPRKKGAGRGVREHKKAIDIRNKVAACAALEDFFV
jgi:malate/lactate dehydrogenase